MYDLSADGGELTMQQYNIKGLKEVSKRYLFYMQLLLLFVGYAYCMRLLYYLLRRLVVIVHQGKLMNPRIFVKVFISNAGEAESLVACAMTKRATAITNANSTSRCYDLSFGSFLKKALCMAVCTISY